MFQNYINKPYSRALIFFILIISILSILSMLLAPLLIPIIISFSLYALLEPLSSNIERTGLSRTAASLSVLLLLVLFAVLSVSLVFPHISSQLSQFQTQLPEVWKSLMSFANNLGGLISQSIGISTDSNDMTLPLLNNINEWGKTALIEASNILLNFAVFLILIPILTFFLIRDFRSFRNFLLDQLPNSSFELGWIIYSRVAHQLQEYIRGIMLQSAIMSIITTAGFYLIGMESPILLGISAGILNLIPYIGPLFAMLIPVTLTLGQVPLDLWLVGASIAVIVIAQLIDNIIVIPSVIANAVNLHPVIVIIGIIIFGNFFGFIGMVVAIPVISSCNIIFRGLLQGIRNRERINTTR